MGAQPPLPPPPPPWAEPAPWAPAAPVYGERGWRTVAIGWVLLHLLIAVAIGVAQLFVSAFVMIASSPSADVSHANESVEGAGWAVLWAAVCLAAGGAGWFCFVYLRRSRAQRWFVFAAIESATTVTGAFLLAKSLWPNGT
jgi:hypothetical protein